DLEQWFVARHLLTRLLEPLGERAFKDRFPHLGHDYVSRHGALFLPEWTNGPMETHNYKLLRGAEETAPFITPWSCTPQLSKPFSHPRHTFFETGQTAANNVKAGASLVVNTTTREHARHDTNRR